MRSLIIACIASLLLFPIVGASIAPAHGLYADTNAKLVEDMLRAKAQKEGIALPDLGTLTAQRVTIDSRTGATTSATIPLREAIADSLAGFADVDISAAHAPDATPSVPTVGVGDDLHAFAALRAGDCSAPSEYTGIATAQSVPGPVAAPNPAGTPFVAAIVWGGPAFHVRGSGWDLGLHLFLGAPIDANANTGSSTGPAPVGDAMVLGTDSSIEAAGVGQVSISWSTVTLFGFCLASIDVGTIFMNGALMIDQQLPVDPLGV